MEIQKYGSVYIWFNTRRKMFYIGCHWGTEDDGYICSSTRMREAYRRNPGEFKRRILSRIYTNRQDLLEKEHKWLSLISDNELGKKYYNVSKKHFGHWAATNNSQSTIDRIKESLAKPEVKEKMRNNMLGDKNPMSKPEISEKVRQKNLGKDAWNKGLSAEDNPILGEAGRKASETKKSMNLVAWNKGLPMPEEQKEEISKFQKDRIWYHNPKTKERITLDKNEIPPLGFIKGRNVKLIHDEINKKKISESSKDRIFWHDPITKKMIFIKKDAAPPENYIRGRSNSRKK